MRILFMALCVMLLSCQTDVQHNLVSSIRPVQKFDGSNRLKLGALDLGQVFSMSLWVKPAPNNEQWSDIFDYRHSGSKSFAFHQNTEISNNYAFGVHSKSGVHGVYVGLKHSVWQHVVIVKSVNSLRIYLNAYKADETSMPPSFSIDYLGDEILTVGGWGYGGREWRGEIACLNIYAESLEDDEVLRINQQQHRQCDMNDN